MMSRTVCSSRSGLDIFTSGLICKALLKKEENWMEDSSRKMLEFGKSAGELLRALVTRV